MPPHKKNILVASLDQRRTKVNFKNNHVNKKAVTFQHFQSLYYANWYQTTMPLYSHIAMTYHIKNIKSSKWKN